MPPGWPRGVFYGLELKAEGKTRRILVVEGWGHQGVAGLTAMLGGALLVAEAMAPTADQAVMVFRDENRQLQMDGA